jgi:hypothetical protein
LEQLRIPFIGSARFRRSNVRIAFRKLPERRIPF